MKASCEMTAGLVADICGAEVVAGDPSCRIRTITTDSRDLGPEPLFIPLIGERFDGHDFLAGLLQDGEISGAMTMKTGFEKHFGTGCPALIKCEDTLLALGSIGHARRMELGTRVVAVTGTNGKTTTKELIYSILSRKWNTLKSEANYNNEIGLPFALLNLRPEHEMAVLEMGMNHAGELQRLSNLAEPSMALITNVGEGHLEFLETVENVALAKAEIFSGMKQGSKALLNRDTNCFEVLYKEAIRRGLEVVTFGLENADFSPSAYKLTAEEIHLEIRGEKIKAPLYGMHNLYNLLAALALARTLGLSWDDVREGCAGFSGVSGRSELIRGRYTVVNDTYNANPLSTESALKSLSEIYPDGRRIAVLSDMKELGQGSVLFHQEIGKVAAETGVHLLLLWGEHAEDYRAGALSAGMDSDKIISFENREELASYIKDSALDGDVILVKGSRSMHMEEVVRIITGGLA